MKIAAAAYPLSAFSDWTALAEKRAQWVADAAGQGANLLVFPEYSGLELSALDGPEASGDLRGCVAAASRHLPRALEQFRSLAQTHQVHICTGTTPLHLDGGEVVNRAHLIAPSGAIGAQDKLIPTPYERAPWIIGPGTGLTVFDTALGRIAILVCYDSEFPLLARAAVEGGADLLLVPSATDTHAGYHRVRIGAQARALECQCPVVQAPLVGAAPWCPAVDINHGAAGVFAPPDTGLPDNGVIALGPYDTPGWTCAEIDLGRFTAVRRDGQVRTRAHWPEQGARRAATGIPLR
ncbi:MAG: carbon-nitrogen hydrolase family protein [Rhodobacteraceae bacterium]|nr:carbon-nitrogen hydrolase family protein [Paracoccaceae bacterium]